MALREHLIMFAVVLVWDFTGTLASRLYANQSYSAIAASLVLTAFWFAGVKLVTRWSLAPTAMVAAALGTLGAIMVP